MMSKSRGRRAGRRVRVGVGSRANDIAKSAIIEAFRILVNSLDWSKISYYHCWITLYITMLEAIHDGERSSPSLN